MDIQGLIRTDLNLLVTLYLLFEERSVSRAADRLFVTQSAVSKALSRLRERFDDPLFTRVGHQLVPTPYLESQATLLVATLNDISRLFEPKSFRPESTRAVINVAFPEMIDMVVTPNLLAYLQFNAPGIKISSERYGEDLLERLATGDADFAISLEYSHYPPEFKIADFLSARPVVLARKGHPLAGEHLSFRRLIQFPRITVKLPDQSLTDFYQSFQVRQQDVRAWPSVFETENLLSALSIISLTDYLLPMPGFVAQSLIATSQLEKIEMPGFSSNMFKYVLVTHQRVAESPLHQWFGGVLQNIGKTIKGGLA